MSVQTTLLVIECPTCISATVFKSRYDYSYFCHDAKRGGRYIQFTWKTIVRPQFLYFQFLIRCWTQCGWAGLTIIQPTNISHKRSWQAWWWDDRRSLSSILKGFFWMLCTRQTRLLALRSSICSCRLSLVCLTPLICANKSNGDKFYRGKSMRAVDEKLINELGPKVH